MRTPLRRPKVKRPKPLTYELIPEASDVGKAMYERLYSIVDEHHSELTTNDARVALAWCTSWKPDADGRLVLGKCKKASELDRQLAPYDFVVLLNKDFWQNPRVSDHQRTAILDHELHHAAVAYDENGDPKKDVEGRTLFRIRKHDLEEFRGIVERYGCYKDDIAEFMRALQRAQAGTPAWVGYTSLSELLKEIGVALEPSVIATWSDDERRDVQTWVLLRRDTNVRVNLATSETIPECIAAALRAKHAADTAPPDHTTAH